MIGSNPTYEGKYLSFLLQEERKSDRILILCFKVIPKEEVPLARGRRAILGHFASWNLWRREIYKEDQEIYGCV